MGHEFRICLGLGWVMFYLMGWVGTWIMLRLITFVVSSTTAITSKRVNTLNSFASGVWILTVDNLAVTIIS